MRIRKHDPVRRRQPGQFIGTLHKLARALAIAGAVFSHGLIKAHSRAAAAVPEQHDLPDSGLCAQILHARFDIECDLFESHHRFVIREAGVHAEHEKTAPGELTASRVTEIIGRTMHNQHADPGSAPIGPVQRAIGRAESEKCGSRLRSCRFCQAEQPCRRGKRTHNHAEH